MNGPDHNWEDRAFSYFRNGISLRTERYRITRYLRDDQPVVELYDHQADPFETINIASAYPDLVTDLLVLLNEGDTGLYNNL